MAIFGLCGLFFGSLAFFAFFGDFSDFSIFFIFLHYLLKILKNSAEKLNLKELSMGMSSDFEKAIINGSTYLRLGTAILGERNTK